MKKLAILIIILGLAFSLSLYEKDAPVGTVILNMDKFPLREVRLELKSCIEGGRGLFSEPMSFTIYTDENMIEQYRELKARLESWGADVTLRKETEQNIFDFRALGELPLYIWNGAEEDIFEAFLSKNAVFYSTGYSEKGYDELVANGNTEGALALLYDNVCIVTP